MLHIFSGAIGELARQPRRSSSTRPGRGATTHVGGRSSDGVAATPDNHGGKIPR